MPLQDQALDQEKAGKCKRPAALARRRRTTLAMVCMAETFRHVTRCARREEERHRQREGQRVHGGLVDDQHAAGAEDVQDDSGGPDLAVLDSSQP
eukprot:464748-Hanusia_phi.AAC.1